jgi:hypothetical protein
MSIEELDIINRFRIVHSGDDGMYALADQLTDLGLFRPAMNEQQSTLRNYAIRVIERMGVITEGDKYQLCLAIANILQRQIVTQEVTNNGRE